MTEGRAGKESSSDEPAHAQVQERPPRIESAQTEYGLLDLVVKIHTGLPKTPTRAHTHTHTLTQSTCA
eukprot:1161965-Pelagomonas_calceolata.AAC.7